MCIFKQNATEILNLRIKSLQSKACKITENNSEKKQVALQKKVALKQKLLLLYGKLKQSKFINFVMNRQHSARSG